MTVFWSLAVLLVLVALIFILPPLFRRPRAGGVRNDELNVQVIRDQLTELRADLESGRLDQAAYEAARHDLQRELLDDVDAAAPAESKSGREGRWLAGLLVVVLPLFAVLIYRQIGTPDIMPRLAAGPAAMPAAGADRQHNLETMVAKLAARMQQQPDNLEGWTLLGRSYASMNRFQDAVQAYQHALQLDGKNPDLLSSYADVLIMVHDGEFTDQVGDLLNQALKADPHHLKALWLRGHWRFRHSNYRGAIDDWQIVMTALPPGDENAVTIQRQINAAKARLGEPVEAVATATRPKPSPPAAQGTAIQVKVSLAPALRDKAAAGDTVFIFARAVQGPRMPLAIVRKRVADLPVSVTLDDSLAMSPAMVLSKFDQVVVGARISKTGQAMPSSGDMQGLVSPVDTHNSGEIQLTIDTQVP